MAKKKAEPKSEKPIVEVVKPSPKVEVKENVVKDKVTTTKRVKFQPNGNNPKLGYEVKFCAGVTAQMFVDKGWGNIIE